VRTGPGSICTHRLEHQPQRVDCRSQVTILLVALTRTLKTTELRTLHRAAAGPKTDTAALRNAPVHGSLQFPPQLLSGHEPSRGGKAAWLTSTSAHSIFSNFESSRMIHRCELPSRTGDSTVATNPVAESSIRTTRFPGGFQPSSFRESAKRPVDCLNCR